jgi:hypothetical protein
MVVPNTMESNQFYQHFACACEEEDGHCWYIPELVYQQIIVPHM